VALPRAEIFPNAYLLDNGQRSFPNSNNIRQSVEKYGIDNDCMPTSER